MKAIVLFLGVIALVSGQTPLQIVQSYFIQIASGNIPGAVQYVDPSVQFVWHGPKLLVPNAGSYTGPAGIESFFSIVNSHFRNLVFDVPSLQFAATTAGNVLVTFREGATNIASGKPYNGQQNVVLYRVANNLITNVRFL